LSNAPICDAGCYCFGSEGNCPPKPTITDSMLPMYRALNHANPMDIICDPFQSSSCVSTLEQGEACVVELIAPNATSDSSCPSGYSYQWVLFGIQVRLHPCSFYVVFSHLDCYRIILILILSHRANAKHAISTNITWTDLIYSLGI
jgi:hypothetical protein